ncbi:MAG: MazG nucleotide pyrophosphohydrolase domain-containing protein [Patescibacteria group bacterium]
MAKKNFKDLCKLAAILRSPKGCPWDRKQTILSMMEHIQEESEEVCQAIKNADNENLKEELGDVIFQIVMIAQIAKENGHFDMNDVVSGIYKKIYSRHTWVFGKDKAKTPEEAKEMWLKNKAIEKAKKSNRSKKAK